MAHDTNGNRTDARTNTRKRTARRRGALLAACGLAVSVFALLFVRTVGHAHPHMSPAQIAARIQELDALIPVVKRERFELILERAAMYDRNAAIVDALLDLRFASLLSPKDPRPYRAAGQMFQLRGCYRAAVPEYQRAIEVASKDDLTTLVHAGECYMELEDWAAARATYERAVECGRDAIAKASQLLAVARAAEKQGDHPAVIAAHDRAVALAKGWPQYLEVRADQRMKHGNYEAAAADYALIAKDADPEEAYPKLIRRAEALHAAGKPAVAKEQYAAAVKMITGVLGAEPAFVEDLYYWRSRARFALGDLAGARKDIDEALVGIPDEAQYLTQLIAVGEQAAQGDPAKADDPPVAAAKKLLAEDAKLEAAAKANYEETRKKVRAQIEAAIDRASKEALLEATLQKAERSDGDARKRWLSLAGRQLEKLAKLAKLDGPRADWCALATVRIDVAGGRATAAWKRLEPLLKKEPENARLRRLRMVTAVAVGKPDVETADRKFLDMLIARSGDKGLLSATPPPDEGRPDLDDLGPEVPRKAPKPPKTGTSKTGTSKTGTTKTDISKTDILKTGAPKQ